MQLYLLEGGAVLVVKSSFLVKAALSTREIFAKLDELVQLHKRFKREHFSFRGRGRQKGFGLYCIQAFVSRCWVRPYLVENTVSRPICEVKQPQA